MTSKEALEHIKNFRVDFCDGTMIYPLQEDCFKEDFKQIEKDLENIEKLKEYFNISSDEDFDKKFKKEDSIFLLSIDEYEKYKNRISIIHCWWWLRSPGADVDRTACVYYDGYISNYGNCVLDDIHAVRPAIRISNLDFSNLKIGDRFVKYDFPWIKIDDDMAIAEVPIAFKRFDENSNDYNNSEIRRFLLNWAERRE